MRLPLITLSILTAVSTAAAEPSVRATATPTYDMGFRVGGYGFKREGDNRAGEGWTECRMNGLGVFGSRAIHGPVFIEAGLDLYTSADGPIAGAEMDLPIDRMSGIFTIAGGARTRFSSRFGAFVQIGAGVEVTRVAVPYGENETIRDTKTLPTGFVGFGLDVRLGKKTFLGINLRTHAMGNFNYSRDELEQRDEWGFIPPDKGVVFDASLDFAAQGQFFVRRDL